MNYRDAEHNTGLRTAARADIPTSIGVDRIAAERRRQVSQEGWTPEHDDTHDGCEMLGAAINYASLAQFIARYDRTDGERFFHGCPPRIEDWPKDWQWKANFSDAIRNLEIAGALIAAEIDRLQRKQAVAKDSAARSVDS